VIGQDPVSGSEGSRYVSNNLTDDDLKNWFGGVASEVLRARRLAREAIDPTVAQWIEEPLRFEERKVTGTGEEAGVEGRDELRQWAPVVFVYLLWISIISITQMLLTNTVEEKSNRTIEVLLSSVSPLQLMSGKILGIAATGLTVVGSWILFFMVGTRYVPRLLDAPPTLDLSALATDPLLIGSFVAYFLLGFLLYAAILVGIGSVVNTLKEAQNLMTPIMFLLIAPLLAMVPIGRDPNGTLAKVLSYVPPFTPFVMMNRAAGPPNTWEYLVTSVLLIVSIGVALWAAAKVFRIGILLTGKPPRPSEIIRWIRAPVGVVPDTAKR
jgi:ABC-type Na+ efflux pump permease subunit